MVFVVSCLKSLAFLEAKEIIETDYATVSSSETVSKTISLFSSSEIYEALVMNSKIAGIVTVRDTLKVLNPERTSISRIMFKPPNMQVEAPIYDIAEALISNRIRILPVLEGGSIKGVVKQKAILNKMIHCSDLSEFTAQDLMVSNLVTANSNDSAAIVKNLMLNRGISHTPVIDEKGRLKGIITAADLVSNFFKQRGRVTVGERKGEKEKTLNVSIKGIIDKHPLDVTPKTAITTVVKEMISLNKGYCLVVEKAKPIGIITPRDILSLLSEFKPRIQIPLYIFGLKGEDEGQLELAKRKLERVANRGQKMHPDLLEFVVHGKVSKTAAEKKRYAIKAKVITTKETLSVNAAGWDLPSAFDLLTDRIDKRLKQVKSSIIRKTKASKQVRANV